MAENGWDMSDFLERYTTKSSSQYISPIRHHDDLVNGSLEKSPAQIDHLQQDVFCSPENLQDRLHFLNQELCVLGFTPLFTKTHTSKFQKDKNENFDITRLVNCTYELLKRQHHQAKAKDDLEERQIRSENDNEYLVQNQVRLKQDLENLKREAALLFCREKDQIEKCRILQQELKSEREEKRKMKSDVDHLKKQFYHESKRTEKEMTRLKEKVHQALNDKSQDRKIGIDILNSLQRADGKRSTWKTAGKKNEEEMYKLLISNYEEKEKGLLTENLSMREMLVELQNMLMSVDSSITSEIVDEDTRQYQMPFHIVKDDVETKLKSLVTNLKEKIDSKQFTKSGSMSTPIKASDEDSFTLKQNNEELVTKLNQCKAVITGQEKIIQSMKDGYSIEAFEKLLTTFGDEEEHRSQEQREKLFREEQKKFNEERKQFTEFVLKMSKEKEEFEKERVEFFMHCLSTPVLKKDKRLHSRSSHHHHPRDSGGGHQSGNFHTVTPTFSPAPRSSTSKMKTPSTADLYKVMSLTYDSGIARTANRSSSFDGSFVQSDKVDGKNSPSSRKLQEHADNIRKAVEERHNKSVEEERRRSLDSSI